MRPTPNYDLIYLQSAIAYIIFDLVVFSKQSLANIYLSDSPNQTHCQTYVTMRICC